MNVPATFFGSAQPWKVFFGVAAGCGIAALPLYFKQVQEKEQELAQARCATNDMLWLLKQRAHCSCTSCVNHAASWLLKRMRVNGIEMRA